MIKGFVLNHFQKNSRLACYGLFSLLASLTLCYTLAGCGGSVTSNGSFTAAPSPRDFGTVTVGKTATYKLSLVNGSASPVEVSSLTVSGDTAFSVTQPGSPITIAAGGVTTISLAYKPASATTDSGTLTIVNNSKNSPKLTVTLEGKGTTGATVAAAAFSSLACKSTSFSGEGSDICTLTLTGAAPAEGYRVSLLSSSTDVTVPATTTVAAGATTAQFTAKVSAVSAAETVKLTAAAGGVSSSVNLSLTTTAGLTANASTVAFGDVAVNTPQTQSVTLTSSGTSAVTVKSASVSGSGFTLVSPPSFPLTLNPQQTTTLGVQFDPTSAKALTGQLTVSSTAVADPSLKIKLTGTGTGTSEGSTGGSGTGSEVALTWDPPSSGDDPVAHYNVYRALASNSSYQVIHSSTDTGTSYDDTTAASGSSYQYYVTSVDSEGYESLPSNTVTVKVP